MVLYIKITMGKITLRRKCMNKDFPRILTLMRKERGLSQKQAAKELDVTQALLSHYENGKRECGLDFLVRAADFYNVSIDYLLGRSPMSSGAQISEQQLPENSESEKYDGTPAGMTVFFQKKLLNNSIDILFALLIKTKNSGLSKSVFNYLSIAIYRCFRMVHSSGKKNDEKSFSIPKEKVGLLAAAAIAVEDSKGTEACTVGGSADEKITTARIEQEFAAKSPALLSVVNNTEKLLNKFL